MEVEVENENEVEVEVEVEVEDEDEDEDENGDVRAQRAHQRGNAEPHGTRYGARNSTAMTRRARLERGAG